MFDFILDYVQKHIWCTPGQDGQSIVQPTRLTPLAGVWNTVRVLWRTLNLPTRDERYHVFQVGQLHPYFLRLVSDNYPRNQWISMADAMNTNKLIVDIYGGSGVQLPRYGVFYMVTWDKDLIIAVKDQPTISVKPDREDIYLRFYRNAYFRSAQSSDANDYVKTVGKTVLNQAAILELQNGMADLQAKMDAGTLRKGAVYAFVNGRRVSGIDLFTAKVGDCVEYVYDSSIYQVLDFSVADLPTFTSTLDETYKYLLHYAAPGDGQINYQDDIDAFLYLPGVNNRWGGVYYHRNNEIAMRMLTHKDYAIPSQLVQAFALTQGWTDLSKLKIRLHVRKGGWNRPLVFNSSRIHELYKLHDADVLGAMVGPNANLDVWKAENLEASAYTQVMRSQLKDLTNTLAQNALGYNALSKVIGDTPSKTYLASNQRFVDLPYGLVNNSTGYELDQDGYLIDFFQHETGTKYACSTTLADMVEVISGQGSQLLDEIYGRSEVPIVKNANYRMYLCPIDQVTGRPTYVWEDVTGTSKYVISQDGATVTFLTDPTKFYPMVRGDRRHLAYSLSIPATQGVLQFSLTQMAVRESQVNTILMEIPMGELDLWLNGGKLVEGVDYFVKFPQIVIVNKKFLKNVKTQNQRVTVRFTGFCKPDFTRRLCADKGFVKWGRLSNNNKFDIRDDKVLTIQVGGRVYDRSELLFAEDDPAVTIPDAKNGEPYQIRDVIVPVQGLVGEDTYSLREKAIVIDKAISAYLTAKLPEDDPTVPNVIPERWAMYSPFLTRIMNDLIDGVFVPSFLKAQYNDQQVVAACAPYLWLLDYDPTQDALQPDPAYTIVHPHNLEEVVSVNVYIYRFLDRVIRLFLHNRTQLSHFVSITPI